MVDKKLDVVSSFLKDNILSTFLLIFFSLFILSCEQSFQNFDQNLFEKKKILEEFNEKSNIRKKVILKSQNDQN